MLRWLALALVVLAPGCVLKKPFPPGRKVVDEVELRGATVVDPDDVLEGLATAGSSRFLGIWDGVFFEYEIFDENILARDLERVERYFRARGFYEAKVIAARVLRVDEHRVLVQLRVKEGDPVTVGAVYWKGVTSLPVNVGSGVYGAFELDKNDIFDEDAFEEGKKAVAHVLGENGYAFAKVRGSATVDIANHTAAITMEVQPGPQAVYGDIRIVGLEEIPPGPVLANLNVREGRRYNIAELEDAQKALNNLGVFASVDIRQDRRRPETRRVPLTVVVQESKLRTLRLGTGVRLDQIRFSANVQAGWEDRNFLGGLRRFNISTKPGLVFFPTRINDDDGFRAPTRLLPENRTRAALRQPSFIEGRTTGLLSGEFNIYPLLYQGLDEGERILGYREYKGSVGAERPFFGHHLYLTPSYNVQRNEPFEYASLGDDLGLEPVTVYYPELLAILDFRDSRVQPREGFYVSTSLQYGILRINRDRDRATGFVLTGNASDIRVRPELRTYLPLNSQKDITLATRLTVGFLFPRRYGSTLADPNPDISDADVLADQQAILFRGFFSGGPNSNRGYPYRGVGPHGPLGLIVGDRCQLADGQQLPNDCVFPLGGLTLWETSLEVRFPLGGPLDAATFLDASDVTRREVDIRFDFPHLSAGAGLRYATPVGPFRFDVGYRLPFAQEVGEENLRPEEGNPGTLLGMPVALHFGLGEAF